MTVKNGTQFESYESTIPRRNGGRGRIYFAEDERLKRKVARKLLPAEFTPHSERLLHF